MTKHSNGPLSIASLQAMSEDDLRVKVLIPLFRNMGFLDVQDYHGGALEQGKDIVMWKRADFGRRNCAVVVKAQRITGQASGSGGAAEVSFQISQCFGRHYHDSVTPEEQVVHECIVACPYEIKKEALHAIESGIDAKNARHVSYLHGQALWEAVRKYLGPRAALAQLREIGQVLDGASPNYRIVAKTRGAQIAVGIEPKHPAAITEEPLLIEGKFEFPSDGPGRAAAAALVQHFETGSPVRVPGTYIAKLELPPLLKELFGDPGDGIAEIAIESRPSSRTFPMIVEVENSRGVAIRLPSFDFRIVQSGSREATLRADRAPYGVKLVLQHPERLATVTIESAFDNVNVTEALEAVRVRNLLADGCTVTFRDGSTRLAMMSTEVPGGSVLPFGEEIESLLTDLVAIQELTHCPISMPERDFTRSEVLGTRGLAAGLRSGSAPIELRDFSATMGRRGVEQLIASPEDGSLRMALVREETVRLLGAEIPVGPVARIVVGGSIHPTERARLAAALLDEAQEEFEVTVDCSGAASTAVYLNHLPAEERAQYRAMFPDFDKPKGGS